MFFPGCSYSRKIALDGELFCKPRALVTGQSSLGMFVISLIKEFHNRNRRELKDRRSDYRECTNSQDKGVGEWRWKNERFF